MSWYVQHGGYIEQGVQRNGLWNIGCLHMTDEGGGAVDFLCKLFLRQTPELAVIRNFQAKLTVFGFVDWVHAITSYGTYYPTATIIDMVFTI